MGILKRYSNFLSYPISLNGQRVNTLGAIWTQPKNEVTDEQYAQFFEYLSNAKAPYKFKLHFSIDVPL
jgi:HSP90 family molecular chaperone